jgi:hypothetical protein
MSTTDHMKAAGKSGQRGRKAPPRGPKADAQPSPKLEQPKAAKAQAAPVVTSARKAPNGTSAPAQVSPVAAAAAPAPARAVTPASSAPVSTAKPADDAAVNLQTIATAYGDYTKKSLEEVRTFVEKLTGARSLNKAIEIQSEFAKQAFETFVSDSQKICGLYGELAKQAFKPLEGLVAKATQVSR